MRSAAVLIATLLAVSLSGCSEDRDPQLWEEAEWKAGLYCSSMGVGGTDANAVYTDEFKNCLEDRQQIEYDELVKEQESE